MERRGSDDTTSWAAGREYGWAVAVQEACSTKVRSGSRIDPGPRSGVVVIVGAGAACVGVGVRSICLGAWEKRVEGREKNKTSRIWGDDVVWEVGSVINGKERARCPPPLLPAVLPSSRARPPATPAAAARPPASLPPLLLLPFLPLERLKWGQALALLTRPSRGVQHGAGKVLFPARGCPPPAMYSTRVAGLHAFEKTGGKVIVSTLQSTQTGAM